MYRIIFFVLCSFFIFCTGCILDDTVSGKKEIILYSTLDKSFTQELLDVYNEKNKKKKGFQPVKAIYELNKEVSPDMVIASTVVLANMKQQNVLQPSSCNAARILPEAYKDQEGYWTGVFYDPVVFVINHQFARTIGQQKILGWNDLENLSNVRYTMENLNNTPGTMNLLAAMACHMGEQSAITYMWNTNRYVTQYTKFPFSSIRLVATGEADMTVTVHSIVCKYLENEFPAYVVFPIEGSPANLYGIACFKGSENTLGNQEFMNWLIANDRVKTISQRQDTGFIYLIHDNKLNPVADPNKVWINNQYLTLEKLEALTNQWVEKVRFSK